MIIIDGKQISAEIVAELKQLPKPNKTLAAVFVGASEASESFLRQKSKLAAELGVDFTICRFSEDVSEDELKDEIKKIGDDEKTGGMIIQLPLPSKFNRENILSALNPKKDVDGLRARDLNQDQIEKLALSDKTKPLAVRTAETILDKIGFDIKDKIVAVVGRGLLVGKPIIQWLKGKCRELIVVDSKGDITRIRKADLVITGVGKAGLIKPEMLKDGAGVIDFGYSRCEKSEPNTNDAKKKSICGDFDDSSLVNGHSSLSFYTPTPGGTGPILVAELFRNFYELCK